MKRRFLALLLFLMLFAFIPAQAEEPAILSLAPAAITPVEGFNPVPLFCGPTQGFYRHYAQTIDLTQPFVCFGQYDCWAMVAQGTPEDFGPVGWIEGGLFDAGDVPELSFDDGFSAMIEETAAVTDAPQNTDSSWALSLDRGTQVTVLAAYGDWLYVQTQFDGMPARVFVPASSI